MYEKFVPLVMADMISYFQKDVKRINHALKVFDFAYLISVETNLDDKNRLIVLISALLHDVGIKEAERKYNSSAGNYQEIEGPPIARIILSKYDIDQVLVDRICFIIGNHHTYMKIDDIDFQILVESDFLVNIFEDFTEQTAIESVKEKIFKTKSGINLIEKLYIKSY